MYSNILILYKNNWVFLISYHFSTLLDSRKILLAFVALTFLSNFNVIMLFSVQTIPNYAVVLIFNSQYNHHPIILNFFLLRYIPLHFHYLEQAVWALGNLADALDRRDFVLCHGALVSLFAQLNEHSKLSMLRIATWTLSKFCCGKPPTPFVEVRRHWLSLPSMMWLISHHGVIVLNHYYILGCCFQVKLALPVLQQLICLNDEEVVANACWSFCYLSDGPNDMIQTVIDAAACRRVVELLL